MKLLVPKDAKWFPFSFFGRMDRQTVVVVVVVVLVLVLVLVLDEGFSCFLSTGQEGLGRHPQNVVDLVKIYKKTCLPKKANLTILSVVWNSQCMDRAKCHGVIYKQIQICTSAQSNDFSVDFLYVYIIRRDTLPYPCTDGSILQIIS